MKKSRANAGRCQLHNEPIESGLSESCRKECAKEKTEESVLYPPPRKPNDCPEFSERHCVFPNRIHAQRMTENDNYDCYNRVSSIKKIENKSNSFSKSYSPRGLSRFKSPFRAGESRSSAQSRCRRGCSRADGPPCPACRSAKSSRCRRCARSCR